MILLQPEQIQVDAGLLNRIHEDVLGIYRLLVFSSEHQSTDLLVRYHEAVNHLRAVLSIKNAQQEAHSLEEASIYLANLKESLRMITSEIGAQHCLSSAVDLFRLFRLISPEAYARHPNSYRISNVQVGGWLAPEPNQIANLVDQLFQILPAIPHPAVRAIYLHHELVRIHPFIDGNGRVSRMAKNWLLMYHLFPPVVIYAGEDRARYVRSLEASFRDLETDPDHFPVSTCSFFHDELLRIKASTGYLFNRMKNMPDERFGSDASFGDG